MSELPNIISLAGQILTIIVIIMYINDRKKASCTSTINKKNNTHEGQEMEKLTKQIKQIEYVHSKGFVDDKEYGETKDKIVGRIKELKGM